MSEKYLPLFRKYRPQSFKDVVGQGNLVKALSNAIELNRIANAYLFCGPRGTGKTSSARILAKSLNCIEGPTTQPCQKCPSCLDITNASGLDVIEIDAATNRGIDDAKELIAQTQYAPMNGKYKIFIIDEVHMLSNEAFNALLKTFEEPPSNVIFILATTEPHKVIETIVSRCQRFDFRRITTDDIVKRLKEISQIENINITDDALYTIAKNVSGGLRDSLALLDQVSILGVKETITKETIEELLGKVTFDVLYNFSKNIITADIETCLKLIDNIYLKGSEPRNFTENFIEFLRNLIFTLNSNDAEVIAKFSTFNKDDIEKIKSDKTFESSSIVRILNKTIEYYKEIKYATNPYLWVELMVIALCKPSQTISGVIPELQKEIKQLAEPAVKSVSVKGSTSFDDTVSAEKILENNNTDVLVNNTDRPPAQKESVAKDFVPASPEVNKTPVPDKKIIEAIPKSLIQNTVIDEDSVPFELNETLNGAADSKHTEVIKEENLTPSAAPQTNAPSSVNNPVTAWTSVLNIIDSVPAKFFYSGVGKLIGLEDNKIVLGFVNQNALMQAKSDSKYKPLLKAVKTALGDSYDADFRLITPETKYIDIKLTAKIADNKPKPKPIYVDKLPQDDTPSGSVSDNSQDFSAFEPMADKENKALENLPSKKTNTDITDKAKSVVYSEKTKAMLETFNGKVID